MGKGELQLGNVSALVLGQALEKGARLAVGRGELGETVVGQRASPRSSSGPPTRALMCTWLPYLRLRWPSTVSVVASVDRTRPGATLTARSRRRMGTRRASDGKGEKSPIGLLFDRWSRLPFLAPAPASRRGPARRTERATGVQGALRLQPEADHRPRPARARYGLGRVLAALAVAFVLAFLAALLADLPRGPDRRGDPQHGPTPDFGTSRETLRPLLHPLAQRRRGTLHLGPRRHPEEPHATRRR